MNRLTEVRLSGLAFPVIMVDKMACGKNVGHIRHGWEERIELADGQTPEQTLQTLLHEVLHFINDSRNEPLGSDNVEEKIEAIAYGMLDFLVNNDLVKLERIPTEADNANR